MAAALNRPKARIHCPESTGLGELREHTGYIAAMGKMTQAECPSTRFADGEKLALDGVDIQAIYVPGHTDDS